MIKIGSWNKQFDIATLVLQGCILLALLAATGYDLEFFGLVLIYLVIAVGHTIRVAKCNYVYYDRATFIIDSLFRKRKVIKAAYFLGVGRSPFSIPLSNIIVLSFRTGDEIAIRGGAEKMEDVESFINGLIRSDGLSS